MSHTYSRSSLGRRNRRRTLLIAGVAFLALTGAAVAAWLVLARGNTTAGIGSLSTPTVAMGPAQHDLYPDGDGVASITITNPNTGTLYITDARASTQNADINSDNPACMGGNYLSINPLTGLHIAVPTGQTVITIPGFYHLAGNTPSECQGATMWIESQLTFSTS